TVGIADRGLQLPERDAVAVQAVRIGVDLVPLDRPAGAGDPRNPWHPQEFALQRVILQCLRVGGRVILAVQRVVRARDGGRTDRATSAALAPGYCATTSMIAGAGSG